MKTNRSQFLISSPYHIAGIFDIDILTLTPAFYHSNIQINPESNSPYRQFYYIIDYPIITEPSKYSHISNPEIICSLLSVQFGKVFYCLGPILYDSTHFVPAYRSISHSNNELMPYNNKIRTEYNAEPNFTKMVEFPKFLKLYQNKYKDAFEIYLAACTYYLQSIRNYHDNPQSAYLELISVGEIVSSLFEFDAFDLLPTEVNNAFSEMTAISKENVKFIEILRPYFRSIKKRFTKALLTGIDENFFKSTYSFPQYSFNVDNIEKSIKLAYDLRSFYIHTGKGFSTHKIYDIPYLMRDIGNAYPSNASDKLISLLVKSPSFTGLERLIRYTLMKLLSKFTSD